MRTILLLYYICFLFSCQDKDKLVDLQQQVNILEKESSNKTQYISHLESEIKQLKEAHEPIYLYAFEEDTESNIVRLKEGESKVIDKISLNDSVDVVYTFKHITTLSQLSNPILDNFFNDYSQFKEIYHPSEDFGPMVNEVIYSVRVFVLCEEEGLPIETENCTDNIYILVQPNELGLKNNLFKISRLFNTNIKSLKDTKDGVVLTLEHSTYPRKALKLLIRPELVKFIK